MLAKDDDKTEFYQAITGLALGQTRKPADREA
jgi:hypothetical protein